MLVLSALVTSAHVPRAVTVLAATSFADALQKHCYKGCPKIAEAWRRGGHTIFIARGAYSLEASTVTKVPFWSAEYVTAAEVKGDADRAPGYPQDPKLKDEPHSTVKDYRSSAVKYDVGHQAPAANHKRSQKRMNETFYLSNMAPQIPSFNRGMWRKLETDARKWISDRGKAYCVTGPIFSNGNRDRKPKSIGRNEVAVPTHFYKIIVAPKPGSQEWESIAFLFPNREYTSPYDYSRYRTTVEYIEQRTGINFMPKLSDAERKRLETVKAPAVW
ncbi:MAG TPA: DNA/RNA non-specific endonuclease [Thermoanaerobaculia bacterium]|nr:DNA/RNA non-specific endonuclease [Thermoanaerobaculia bacterium]